MLVTDLLNWKCHQNHKIINIRLSSTLLPSIWNLVSCEKIRHPVENIWTPNFGSFSFCPIRRPFFAPWTVNFLIALSHGQRRTVWTWFSSTMHFPSTVIIYRYQWKSMAYQPALKSIKSERRRDRIARNLERANKEVIIYLI